MSWRYFQFYLLLCLEEMYTLRELCEADVAIIVKIDLGEEIKCRGA